MIDRRDAWARLQAGARIRARRGFTVQGSAGLALFLLAIWDRNGVSDSAICAEEYEFYDGGVLASGKPMLQVGSGLGDPPCPSPPAAA
jgi:hypothetical protein